jgi:hypothetical protein
MASMRSGRAARRSIRSSWSRWAFEFLAEREPGQWWVRDLKVAIPITFSVHAVRRA